MFSNVEMQKKPDVSRKTYDWSGQIVIVPYMKDANNDILFTMKCIENNFCTDVYRERLHLQTRFKLDNVRKTEVTTDSTI